MRARQGASPTRSSLAATRWGARAPLRRGLGLRGKEIAHLRNILSPSTTLGVQESHEALAEVGDMVHLSLIHI
eukprot:81214-Pyramimonas_sp.AAC.1